MSKVEEFKSFLKERFGIHNLPKLWVFQEHDNAIRVFSKTLMNLKGVGYMGFVAGAIKGDGFDIKTPFAQIVGKFSTKSIINLNEEDAKVFVESGEIKLKDVFDEGYYIVKFGEHVLGSGYVEKNVLKGNFFSKGRIRVKNKIKVEHHGFERFC